MEICPENLLVEGLYLQWADAGQEKITLIIKL